MIPKEGLIGRGSLSGAPYTIIAITISIALHFIVFYSAVHCKMVALCLCFKRRANDREAAIENEFGLFVRFKRKHPQRSPTTTLCINIYSQVPHQNKQTNNQKRKYQK